MTETDIGRIGEIEESPSDGPMTGDEVRSWFRQLSQQIEGLAHRVNEVTQRLDAMEERDTLVQEQVGETHRITTEAHAMIMPMVNSPGAKLARTLSGGKPLGLRRG